MPATDPADLTARLIRCPSVTPEEGGALTLLEPILSAAGFTCTRIERGEVSNLFARWGDKAATRRFGFNGHTDVVPPGNPDDWRFDPFSGTVAEGKIWGRGACDMKSGVAAFVAAAVDFVTRTPPGDGAVIVTITGDEEGDSIDGTPAILDWMAEAGESMTHCLVGEPTCPQIMGEMIKHGRRGSLTATITAHGVQGHSAYPHRARNPLPPLVALLDRLARHELDTGNANFDRSTLALTSIDTGNPASNVIPAQARAVLNIRFNDSHSGHSLTRWLEAEAEAMARESGVGMDLAVKISGESFVTAPGTLTDLVARAVKAECGITPELSTSGGTSDARFIKDHCPVVEFGLVGQSMHQVDEQVEIDQIHQLKAVYMRVLEGYFGKVL
ncbi:MAG TPA: succinyl-diaminopimelate desuccinylase [Paracoccus sp.]|nr:succinyl-diaminopimelate desuccinylase [Paracoccus sp. (in: a-proteobacteria)]